MPEEKKPSLEEAMMQTIEATESTEEPPEAQDQPEASAEQPDTEADVAAPGGDAEADAHTGDEPAPVAAKSDKATAAPVPAKKAGAAPAKPPAKPGVPRTIPVALTDDFHKTPQPLKDWIMRREGQIAREREEHSRTAKKYGEVTKSLETFHGALEPFMPNLKALGVAPADAMRELFQVDHILRVGSKDEQARLVANIIRARGVDVQAIASHLDGTPAAATAEKQPEEYRDKRVDAMLAASRRAKLEREQGQKAQAEAEKRKHLNELREFAASGEAEFFEKVLPQMNAVQLAAREAGEELTLQELYDQACYLNKEVRSLMKQRENDATKMAHQSAQQARIRQALSAGSSVRSEPAAPQGAQRPDLDGALRNLAARFGQQER